MALIDMSSTLADFVSDTLTVTRAAGPGTHVDGVYVPAATSTISVAALVVPQVSAQQLERLPEGRRSRAAIEVYSTVELRCNAPEQGPDVIAYGGYAWEVSIVDDWAGAGNFFHAIAVKVPSGEEAEEV